MDGDPTPALTGRRRTRPTSPGCRNPQQPEPGRTPLISAKPAVQSNRATSLQVQLVHSAHDGQIGRGPRSGQVVDAATTDPERFGLLGDRQIMGAVDHRFALSRPALLSAPDKKSCPRLERGSLVSVSSPILACNVLTSTAGVAGSD